jgi:hypothetical protein
MAFIPYQDNRNQNWLVNSEGVWHIVRASIYAEALRRRMRRETEYNLFSADLVHINTDLAGLPVEVDRLSIPLMREFELLSIDSGEEALRHLAALRRNTLIKNREIRELNLSALNESQRNILSSIDTATTVGETGIAVSRAVRDFSATVLITGAALLSGGAAIGAVGAGAMLRGSANYEQTGNVGSALIVASTEAVVGYFPLTTTAGISAGAGRERAALILLGATVDATGEYTKTLVGGGTVRAAYTAAAARFGVNVVSQLGGLALEDMLVPTSVKWSPASIVTPMTRAQSGQLGTGIGITVAGDAAVGAATPTAAVSSAVDAGPPRADANVAPVQDCARSFGDGLLPERMFVERTALRRQ